MLLHTRQGHVGRLKAGHLFPPAFRAFKRNGKGFTCPLRTVGGDGIGQVNMLLCPLLTGANHPGLLSVRQRDTVTGNRCHRPDAVGHITALPVTLREAHPVTGSHPDGVRGVQCDAFSHRLPGRNQPRVTFRILQGYQPVILADTGNPVIHTIHQGKGIPTPA